MAKLCMGCMNPLSEDSLECKVCGFDISKDKNPEHCLPITASLQGHYIVGRLMGEFPDHLLYLAYDRQMKEPCFIQEFFPASIGRRDTIGGIQPLEGCNKVFEEYADRFRTTMRILARMRELPSVVPVYDIFEENGTVYAVSDYCQGMTLTKKIKLSGGRIPWPEARSIFMSLLSSLSQLSDAGICHLAICPDNILIGSDGKARLRNFSISAAHISGTDLQPDLKAGYAAPEQYCTDEEVGVPADVYALAATIFRTVTGTEPPAGDNRAKNSDDLFMSAEVAEELTQPVCVALFNALQVLPERRTANLAMLRDQLSITPQVSALVDEAQEDIAQTAVVIPADEEEEDTKSGRGGLIAMLIISLVLLLAAVGVIVWMILGGGDKTSGGPMNNNSGATTTTQTQQKQPSVAGEGEALVKNMVGEVYTEVMDEEPNGMPLEVIGYAYDENQPEGVIIKQFPLAEDVQATGDPIYVVVNSARAGAERVEVPRLIGWQEANAKMVLEYMGFTVKTIQVSQADYEAGLVNRMQPGAGSEVDFGSEITLFISTKKATTVVPNLAGASKAEVRKALELLGLVVQEAEVTDSVYAAGLVDRVEKAGESVAIGSTVTIYVSAAPAVENPDVEEPTDDPVYEY